MAFDSGWDAGSEYTSLIETRDMPHDFNKKKFTEFLMMLGLDELKVN